MAFDCYLKIDGIPGESTDDDHADWIDVLSFSHQVAQPIAGARADSVERVDHGLFTVTKCLDAASPLLSLACCKGDYKSEATLSLNEAGGDRLEYMVYKLTDVVIAAVRPGGSGMGGEKPMEEVSLAYGAIQWTYTKKTREDGTGGGQVSEGWNLKTNKPL